LVNVTLPVFVTTIVKSAVPPLTNVGVEVVFVIEIEGFSTTTLAVAVAVTLGPDGGVPVSVALLVSFAVTFGCVQV
jgi:hypothetical protein